MPVEVTEVKEIHIKWEDFVAVVKGGDVLWETPNWSSFIRDIETFPKGFVEFAQRIADALNESRPKEPRRHRKDKGRKRNEKPVTTLLAGNDVRPPMEIVNTGTNYERPFDFVDNADTIDESGGQASTHTAVPTQDIFSTFEMKVPEPGTRQLYIFRMGGQECVSKTMREGILGLLEKDGVINIGTWDDIKGVLDSYPDSPQLQQVKDILFPKEVKRE